MSTYFVKGTYTKDGQVYKFGVVFDLQSVNAKSFVDRLQLELKTTESISVENIVKL